MASPEAIRALRSILRMTSGRTPPATLRRKLCTDCLAKYSPTRRGTASDTRPRPPPPRTRNGTPPPRAMATMAEYRQSNYNHRGPLQEYDSRVKSGRLRDDEHQRTLIQSLQDLHDELLRYTPPRVQHPTIESLQRPKKSFFGSIFGGGSGEAIKLSIPDSLPKGLYMYGDVGSGKTMLMDLFYDTLPPNIHAKTRIHFHNFMQDVHKELHKMKMAHGTDIDAIPFVAASIAERATVLCFDEFQVTDVADAMILRRMMESLMAHGVVLVTTSNRHPKDLYKNGIQRESFLPCIHLLEDRLRVINLDSDTDYRKIPRPPSGVYHHPLDAAATRHADHWFRFLGDFPNDPVHEATHSVWGREIHVPRASGRACHFTFAELMGRAMGPADYLELVRNYDAFVVTDVPGMNVRTRDLARRFITFLDAAYESRAKLVLTTAVPLTQLFMSQDEVGEMLNSSASAGGDVGAKTAQAQVEAGANVDDAMRSLMDDLGLNMETLKKSSMFTGDEEAFAFARALSRLTEMGSREWVERGLGLESQGGKKEKEDWNKVRGHWRMDSY